MEIKNFDIEDIFRFLVTGFWFYFIFSFVSEDKLPFNMGQDSIPFLILALLSIGTMLYFSFRTLVYPLLVRCLDLFFPNARSYIKKKYSIECWVYASDLWQVYQSNNLDDFKGNYKRWLPSIHMLCISSIITLVGSIYYSFHVDNPCPEKKFILWLLFIIFVVSSIVSQVLYELRLLSHLKTHDDTKLTELVERWKSKGEKSA